MKSLYKAGHEFGIAPGCAHNGGGMLASEPGSRAFGEWLNRRSEMASIW